MTGVRISAATPEADLLAAIQPGVSRVYLSCVESPLAVATADALITALERRRGMRLGTVALRPLIESATGVALAHEIAAESARVDAVGPGPHIDVQLGSEGLQYARVECELVARALRRTPIDIHGVLD